MLDDLGLGANRQELIGRIGEIYHVAACTSLSQTMEDARQTNLLGTEHVIELAQAVRKTGNPVHLHHISTAYVSGTRTGCVTEDELECGQEFFNYYEWSKFEAERAVRKAGVELPVTIYRPGLIVGDSLTGRTSRFQGIYQMLQWIHSGLLDSLPCPPDFQLDLAPVDYVCSAIVRLAQLGDSANKTFHLAAGPGNTLTLNELVEIYLQERAACEGGDYLPRAIRFSPPEENSLPANHEAPPIWKRFAHYIPYFTCPKVFDNSVARAALRDLQAPNCRQSSVTRCGPAFALCRRADTLVGESGRHRGQRQRELTDIAGSRHLGRWIESAKFVHPDAGQSGPAVTGARFPCLRHRRPVAAAPILRRRADCAPRRPGAACRSHPGRRLCA